MWSVIHKSYLTKYSAVTVQQATSFHPIILGENDARLVFTAPNCPCRAASISYTSLRPSMTTVSIVIRFIIQKVGKFDNSFTKHWCHPLPSVAPSQVRIIPRQHSGIFLAVRTYCASTSSRN
jgi:hypothetical protein